MVRVGYLADCENLVKKARSKIYPVIENADADGYLGPDFLKDGLVWSHAVYFRALTALYTATKDEKVLEALKKHFLRVPLADVFDKQKDYFPVLYVRDIADIETALWIYGQTGDKRFLAMAEDSYAVFNEVFKDDTNARPAEEMRDLTVPGMLANRKVCRNHGVTYCEICKLPAILYMYTGKEIYKKAAVNAFEKLYRDQMLVDGVNSSSEYLNGNDNSHAMHETCDVSDLTWALGYLYMITGDPKYGDRIEEAIFNAGLGSVDDDFTSSQYFSCPNQVIADENSNHVFFYRGWPGWHTFAPEVPGGCCAGNVHRFMPNFAARAWMLGENEAFAALYAPTEISLTVGGTRVKIEEKTAYPFENTVRFLITPDAPVAFTLTLRVPAWATSYTVTVNGEAVSEKAKKGILKLNRTFCAGDVVTISFTDEIRFVENAKGVSVKKGALLYALPVKERVVVEGLRKCGNEKYPRYSLYADSDWSFGVNAKNADATLAAGATGDEPWRAGEAGLSITLNAYRLPRWKLRYTSENGLQRLHPRKGYVQKIGHKCTFTPRVPENILPRDVGEKCRVTLVPYAGTRLRVAIFPKVK
jgi:DUF1680 family protein